MKYFTIVIVMLLSIFTSHAQTYELGGLVGGSKYIGDVGSTQAFPPTDLAFGGVFKWNRSPRHSFRLNALIMGISGDDSNAKESRRVERGYDFKNTLTEFSLGLEYTFWEFDLHTGKPQNTPYLFLGVGYFGHKSLYLNPENSEIEEYDTTWEFAIPMAVGYKFTVATKAVLGIEIGARYTFTDNLDGNNPTGRLEDDFGLKFGNVNNNDWYFYTGVYLTFAFGREPCYCNF